MDETPLLNGEFHSRVSQTFNSMTHRELVFMPTEFYPHETHLSLLKNLATLLKALMWLK
jgi:hypothetical protein